MQNLLPLAAQNACTIERMDVFDSSGGHVPKQLTRETRIVYLWTSLLLTGFTATNYLLPMWVFPAGVVVWVWMFGFGFYLSRHKTSDTDLQESQQ